MPYEPEYTTEEKLQEISGVGEKRAQKLADDGFDSVEDVAYASQDELTSAGLQEGVVVYRIKRDAMKKSGRLERKRRKVERQSGMLASPPDEFLSKTKAERNLADREPGKMLRAHPKLMALAQGIDPRNEGGYQEIEPATVDDRTGTNEQRDHNRAVESVLEVFQ